MYDLGVSVRKRIQGAYDHLIQLSLGAIVTEGKFEWEEMTVILSDD